jgi:hypothetical protein
MDKTKVIALLEKYWQAETTIEEEQALAAYFRGGQVDTELLPYVELFAYFREEARVSAGPDFGDRILQRLGLPTDTKQAGDASAAPATNAPAVPAPAAPTAPVRHFRLGVIAAAAAILLVVAGVFLLKPAGGPAMLAEVHPNGHRTPAETRSAGVTRITDTYDDPQQALAAVRHALLIASHQLNQGRRQLAGARK